MMTVIRARVNIFVLAIAMGLFGIPLHAAVKTTPVNKTDLGAINAGMADSAVEVEATVKSITLPREGTKAPVKINLTDATGSMNLVLWADLYDIIKAQSPLAPGDFVHISAHVSNYKETLQLQVRAPGDVKIITKAEHAKPAADAPPPTPTTPEPVATSGATPLAGITTALLNKEVTVQASITEIREPRSDRAPYIVTLVQDDARIPMVFWSDLQKQIKDNLKVGNTVRVKAQVMEHGGKLEIKLRNATDLTVVSAPAPASTSP